MSKTMIVYYSRTGENYWNGSIKNLEKGNTETVAEMIAEGCESRKRIIHPRRRSSTVTFQSRSLG